MNTSLQNLMREATRLTQSGKLHEATAVIQNALRNPKQTPSAPLATSRLPSDSSDSPIILDGCVFEVGDGDGDVDPQEQFVEGRHTDNSLTRRYKLYTPPGNKGKRLSLVVMLHGCTQNSDDFSAGTGMNKLAKEHGFYVLYPEQSANANAQRCWNWFKKDHQGRGEGESAFLANLTLDIVNRYDIDPHRIYIAGLSAGGAMAAIVAAAYPELFAAVGIHSGLAAGTASNVSEALVAMKSGALNTKPTLPSSAVPTIVFHGDKDHVVNPCNAQRILSALQLDGQENTEHGRCKQGRAFTRTLHMRQGASFAELWILHGVGHAWSGGDPAGSYTDSTGPDASAEMLRFFGEHTLKDEKA
jgi:poly(hydroxyalkanoate) depolymerase family esterase